MSKACHEVYNFASTFSLFVPNFAAEYLHKSYKKDTFDLAELDLHNAIEHDGSLVRELLPPIFVVQTCRFNSCSNPARR